MMDLSDVIVTFLYRMDPLAPQYSRAPISWSAWEAARSPSFEPKKFLVTIGSLTI